jgi:RNA polymerase sigma factor (sigma-70 family)
VVASKYIVNKEMDKIIDKYISYLYNKHFRDDYSFDFDDFRSYCLYEYLKCVRRWESNKQVPLNFFVRSRLKNAVIDYLRTNGVYNRNNIKRTEVISIDKIEEDREKNIHLSMGENKKLIPKELTTLPMPDFYIDFERILKTLTLREQNILKKYCLDKDNYEIIGADLGVTGCRIGQIMTGIKKKVKKYHQRNLRRCIK